MRTFFMSGLAAFVALSFANAAEHEPRKALENGDIRPYAKYCSEIVGAPLPSFDCLADGREIPITLNGRRVGSGHTGKCDRPSLNVPGCAQGARLGRIVFDNPDISAVFICRPAKNWTPQRPRFGRIAVTQHNRKNGATCWYNTRRPEVNTDGVPGNDAPEILTRRIASPVDSMFPNAVAPVLSDGRPAQAAERQKWASVSGFVCQSCHAPDP